MVKLRIIVFLLCLASVAVPAAQLQTISRSQLGNKTALNFTIQGSFTHHVFFLANPNRIVMDLTDTRMLCSLNHLQLKNSLIQNVRSGHPNAKTLRLVFDLSRRARINTLPWRLRQSIHGIQLVITPEPRPILIQAKPEIKKLPNTIVQHSASKPPPVRSPHELKNKQALLTHQKPIQALHVPSLSLRDVVVVLDAGHGGKDPGAKGPRKSCEKDIVLAISLKLKKLIDQQVGMHAVLTRSGDYYVGLRNRLDIARKYNGDIFVSIHADAFKNPHSNGASVFALSQRGATSEAARWLAEKENYSELGGVNLGDLDDRNGIVRSVLIDLSQTATINSGLKMGNRVLNQLESFTRLHNNKVEQARFMVLKSPDIPSILVETGFISNPREENNLRNPAYQARLSQAIFQGIKGYFWESPPHGSRIEAMTSGSKRYHIARSGETLSSIARNYHVSLASLQAINHLWAHSKPNPGQKLVIPSAWS